MPTSIAEFFLPTRVVFGPGSLSRLGAEVRALRAGRVVVVTDQGIAGSGILARALAELEGVGIPAATFDEVEPEPSVRTVGRVLELFLAQHAEAFIAVGGGSAIDAAKAAAVWATNGGRLTDFGGHEKFANPPAPVLALPTTAGTGAEVSSSSVITDHERHVKFSIRHARLNRARVAILDPQLLATCPPAVAVDAGLDALAHAVESYTSLRADPFTEALSLRAVELIGVNLRPFVANRADVAAGGPLMAAAAMAAIAFSTAGVGNAHCLARFVGPALRLSHGRANAILLPHVMAFNLTAAPAKYARLARALAEPVAQSSDFQAAEQAARAVAALGGDLGVPAGLKHFAAEAACIPAVARAAFEAGYNQWNPRFTTSEEFAALLRQIFAQ